MKKLILLFVLTIVFLAAMITNTYAGARGIISDPEDFGPYYTDWYGDNDWVVFIFYRDPSCVPEDFNILQFFDFNAVNCGPITVKGFEIRKNSDDVVPKQGKYLGLGYVPVWFLPKMVYDNAVSDGVLTIVELEDLYSLLKGYASFYEETLHPYMGPPFNQGHPVPMKNIVAHGVIEFSEDYEIFWFNVLWFLDGRNINVNVVLK